MQSNGDFAALPGETVLMVVGNAELEKAGQDVPCEYR